MNSNLLMAAIMPHPPIMVPEVGGDEIKHVKQTIRNVRDLSHKIYDLNSETIVFVTPHSYYDPEHFTVYGNKSLEGDLTNFNAPEVRLVCKNDVEFVHELSSQVQDNFGKLNILPPQASLDHGTAVPLYFISKAGFTGKIVVINYSGLSPEQHIKFGEIINKVINKLSKKTVFIASGDLSHRLSQNSPARYNADAKKFDEIIKDRIGSGDYNAIINIDPALRVRAGECGYNSLMVAFGLLDKKPVENKVYSYEAPFGVGYIVATL